MVLHGLLQVLPLHFIYIFVVGSFLLAFLPKPCIHSFCLLCVLHNLPISASLTSTFFSQLYLGQSKNQNPINVRKGYITQSYPWNAFLLIFIFFHQLFLLFLFTVVIWQKFILFRKSYCLLTSSHLTSVYPCSLQLHCTPLHCFLLALRTASTELTPRLTAHTVSVAISHASSSGSQRDSTALPPRFYYKLCFQKSSLHVRGDQTLRVSTSVEKSG
jgi:hypothetical protein